MTLRWLLFCLIWHPASTDPRKELRSLEAALALGPPGCAPLSVGQSPGHTRRDQETPVPAHSHLSAQGCRWESRSGCVWKTASRNPGEPHFHRVTHWTHSACKEKGNTRNNGSQVLIKYDQPGIDNIWPTSCWCNRNNQVQLKVKDWFLFYIHLLKLPQIYIYFSVYLKKNNSRLLNTT